MSSLGYVTYKELPPKYLTYSAEQKVIKQDGYVQKATCYVAQSRR